MFTRITNFIKNLKIKYKILLCMVTIATIALLFISILSYDYFVSVYEQDNKNSVKYTLDIVSVSFRNRINYIFKNTSRFVSSDPMLTTLQDISLNNTSNYITNYGAVQDNLEALIQSDSLINNVIIVGKNDEFFGLAKYGLNHDVSYFLPGNLGKKSGISLLPLQRVPFSPFEEAIPIILPISNLDIGSSPITPIISGNAEDSVANIFILLDANRVDEYFRELNKNVNATVYLADQTGKPVNLSTSSDIYDVATNPDVINHIKASSSSIDYNKSINKDTFLISLEDVGVCNLKIVSIVSKGQLLSGVNTIKSFILLEWALSFGLTLILSLMLSQFITHPIVSLMNVVRKIKDGTYDTKYVTKYNDEIGILNNSINAMYDTIKLQIELIKQDEQDKAKSEIKILAEQINPHFIYNTLECIHLEILNKNTEASASMIESLGDFLRIALNYGNVIIPIEQELKHTSEYINIMNHRSNKRIAFNYTLDNNLKFYKVVKLILQPLVENSIKHGFANDINSGIILSPRIEINIRLEKNNRTLIEVSDNGRGIDIDKANSSLYQLSDEGNKHHVGLNNIYNRLRLYYDNSVKITFNTTPYYKNSVVIDIPYVDSNNK